MLFLLCTSVTTAHDFEIGGIYYNITDVTSKIVLVTYKGNYDLGGCKLRGIVEKGVYIIDGKKVLIK